jgi:hypothetical protein
MNSSSILKLPEFFRITISNNPSDTLACGAALNPPPKYMPLASKLFLKRFFNRFLANDVPWPGLLVNTTLGS